jgi:hypothetical protein
MSLVLTPDELSTRLWERFRIRRSTRRLAQLRANGGGPPYRRDGVVVRYPVDHADEWAEQVLGELVTSTAQETAARQIGRGGAVSAHDR